MGGNCKFFNNDIKNTHKMFRQYLTIKYCCKNKQKKKKTLSIMITKIINTLSILSNNNKNKNK